MHVHVRTSVRAKWWISHWWTRIPQFSFKLLMRYIRHQSVIDTHMHMLSRLEACFVRRSTGRNACQSVWQPPPHLLVNGEWIFDNESYGPIKFQLGVHSLLTDILCTWPADIYRMYLLFTARCESTCANDISTLRENSHLSEFTYAVLHQTSREKRCILHGYLCVQDILWPPI